MMTNKQLFPAKEPESCETFSFEARLDKKVSEQRSVYVIHEQRSEFFCSRLPKNGRLSVKREYLTNKRLLATLACLALLPSVAMAKPPPAIQRHFSSAAEALEWVRTSDRSNLCGGYYLEPQTVLMHPHPASYDQSPIRITSKNPSLLAKGGVSRVSGDVDITQPGRNVLADTVLLYRSAKTKKIKALVFKGNVHLFEPGRVLVGDWGKVDLLSHTAMMKDAYYRLNRHAVTGDIEGWGKAETLYRASDGVVTIENGTYTACSPTNHAWHVEASTLHLDKKKGWGRATNARLYFYHLPIFYWPYFTFPLNKERQTGFLYPTFGFNSRQGFDVSFPFYWNIASNVDALLTPTWISKRGFQFGQRLRYLTAHHSGQFFADVLPDDRLFSAFKEHAPATYGPLPDTERGLERLAADSPTRWMLSWSERAVFDDHWSGGLDANWVSDDYYFLDLDNTPRLDETVQLLNEAHLNYASEHWDVLLRAQTFQTLHPLTQPLVENQYSRAPQINVHGEWPVLGGSLVYALNSEYAYFDHARTFLDGDPVVSGQRINVAPSIAWPRYGSYGYFRPRAQLQATFYALHHQDTGKPSKISRVLPIIDVDAGLYYDRSVRFFGHDYQQTLEPRLYYLFVPSHSQADIPVFDTVLQPFRFEQLFRVNRFVGLDRTGDANQVTLALTTRFIDSETGIERVKAGIGEILYFHQPRVCLDGDCLNDPQAARSVSPVVGDLQVRFAPHWKANGTYAWDPKTRKTQTGRFALYYQKDHHHVLNANYSFIRGGDIFPGAPVGSNKNDLHRLGLSAGWTLNPSWSVVGGWYYNFSHQRSQSYFSGLQYESCCWAVRFIASREYTGDDPIKGNQFDNHYYVQLRLKGLSHFESSDPSDLLTNYLPGYSDDFRD